MSQPADMQVDANRVISRLGQMIGQLQVENAQLDALVHQLLAERTNGVPPAEGPSE